MSSLYSLTANQEFDQLLSVKLEQKQTPAVTDVQVIEDAVVKNVVDDIPTYEAMETNNAAAMVSTMSSDQSIDLSKITTLSALQGLMNPNKPKLPLVRFKHKGKSSKVVQLDSTLLAPNRKLIVGRSFGVAYREQLDAIIYNQDKELNPDALMSLSMMFGFGKGTDPVLLKSQYYNRLLPLICEILNDFYKQNHSIIENISYMINDQIRPEVQPT